MTGILVKVSTPVNLIANKFEQVIKKIPPLYSCLEKSDKLRLKLLFVAGCNYVTFIDDIGLLTMGANEVSLS